MRRLLSILLAVSVLAVHLPRAASSDPFLLALVRDDGVMLPIAAHDRGRWRTPWPEPVKEADVPVRVEDCPLAWWGLPSPARQWTLHVPEEPPRTVTTERVTWVLNYCQQQVALHSRAAMRETLRPPVGARAPRYGVAVSGSASIVLPRPVSPESAEGRALLDGVQTVFNREERLMLALDHFAAYRSPLPASERDRRPVVALAIHSGPGIGGDVYFVELERRYPRRQPERLRWCDEVTYMAGWIRKGGDGKPDLTLVTRGVTSCLLDTVPRATPHVVAQVSGGPVWMIELYRTNSEMIELYRAPTGDVPDVLARRLMGACE